MNITIKDNRLAVERRFEYAFRTAPGVEIRHGEWTAQTARSNQDGCKYTMRVTQSGHDFERRFYAEDHPEGRFPMTDAPASPVDVAAFLQECQQIAAKSPMR